MITALVGAQFGSEGKGAVAAHIAKDYKVHVRVGAANAGHTIYTTHDEGLLEREVRQEKHVLQQIPCAAYANPEAVCMIGPGALISPEIMANEIQRNETWRSVHDFSPLQLVIDRRAHVITEDAIRKEAETDLAERIGSTSTIAREGIGQATADRVMREGQTIEEWCKGRDGVSVPHLFREREIPIGNVPALIREANRSGNVLLEGTQGTGLSLTTGQYPYCTSRNTTAAGLIADCGVSPADLFKTILVARTYPIRVAGNSGPFAPGSEEINFSDIGVDPETTTVTKKERRVATFSMRQMREAYELNRAPNTEIALMFADYMAPSLAGATAIDRANPLPDQEKLWEMIIQINAHCEHTAGETVRYLGTGPRTIIDLETSPVAA